jgi:hypothetical protein
MAKNKNANNKQNQQTQPQSMENPIDEQKQRGNDAKPNGARVGRRFKKFQNYTSAKRS